MIATKLYNGDNYADWPEAPKAVFQRALGRPIDSKLLREIVERLRAIPGVVAASATQMEHDPCKVDITFRCAVEESIFAAAPKAWSFGFDWVKYEESPHRRRSRLREQTAYREMMRNSEQMPVGTRRNADGTITIMKARNIGQSAAARELMRNLCGEYGVPGRVIAPPAEREWVRNVQTVDARGPNYAIGSACRGAR